jgi:GntR family transcriptional regulator
MQGQASDQSSLLKRYAFQTRVELVNDSQIPLYYQLARILQRFVRETGIDPGEQFPSEEAIGLCFGVSRPTVNKAIQELITQGWLKRIRGKGTFVEEDPRVQLALLHDSMSPVEQFPEGALTYKVIDRQVQPATRETAADLRLEPETPILFIRRLRVLHEHPLCVCDSLLPAARFPGLGEKPFFQGSLYATLQHVYHSTPYRSRRCVEASEVVEREVADLLQIPLLSPILFLSGVTYSLEDDAPVEVMRSRFREGLSLVSTVTRDVQQHRSATTAPGG